jgi:serine/threonine protein kinase
MGVVYRARDPKIDRFVAVKTISLLGISPDEALEYRERFFQEAQAVGRLVHPGIVTVFDVGEEPESRTPYIVMEYVDGVSLDELLKEKGGKLPLNTALQLTEELAEALDCAHGQGIVHRDMKPANILVTSAGRAKITDFGIAKLNLAHMTLPGHVLGTPAYMSPEQLSGEPLDGRSDLFSLGIILYSMVSGHRPFQGNSVTTVCFKLANHEPLPPSALEPGLPAGVDAVIARAMAKEPAERYQRGLEFALDVHELRERLFTNSTKSRQFSAGAMENGPDAADLVIEASRGNTGSVGVGRQYLRRRKPFWVASELLRARTLQVSMLIVLPLVMIAMGGLVWYWVGHRVPLKTTQAVANSNANSGPAANASPQADASSDPVRHTPETPAAPRRAGPASKPGNVPSSTLVIGITYPFEDCSLSVFDDSHTLYAHSLKAEATKRLGLFRKVEGHALGTVRVPAGEHQLRVRVESKTAAYDQVKVVAANFSRGEPQSLQISFHGRQKEMRLDLH